MQCVHNKSTYCTELHWSAFNCSLLQCSSLPLSPYRRQGIPANARGGGVCVYLIRASLAHSYRPPVGKFLSGYYSAGNTHGGYYIPTMGIT